MESPYLPKDASVLIVGSGTWGLSTALHLARRGYINIKCLDRYAYPSPDSAAFDLNKIVGMRNDPPIAARVSRDALAGWHDPLFKDVWHEVGLITAGTDPESIAYCRTAYQSWVDCGEERNVRWLETAQDFHKCVPQLSGGSLPGWKGFFHRRAGWAHARDSMKVAGDEARRLGVEFSAGPQATMKSLLLDGNGQACGIIAEDGTKWYADRIVMTIGAWTDSVVDMEGQIEARCYAFAHVQLSQDECDEFKGIPVVMNLDEGFFFEPSKEGLIKVLYEYPGYIYNVKLADGRTTSLPWSQSRNPKDTIPDENRAEIHKLLGRTVPRFQTRTLLNQRLCWCTDSRDRNWLIDFHPIHKRLIIATGDSGTGFKMLPVMGQYIGDLVEGSSLEPLLKTSWRWRPGEQGWTKRQGWNGTTRDLREMTGWQSEDTKNSEA